MPEENIIRSHMEVLGSDGEHVGTVDTVEDGRIKLTPSKEGGEHHFISALLVQDIRGNAVTITRTAGEALSGEDPG